MYEHPLNKNPCPSQIHGVKSNASQTGIKRYAKISYKDDPLTGQPVLQWIEHSPPAQLLGNHAPPPELSTDMMMGILESIQRG